MNANKTAELSGLLANVRDAYRLIWAYQRRCLDTVQVIADQFPELSFYQWSSLLSNHPPSEVRPPSTGGRGTTFPCIRRRSCRSGAVIIDMHPGQGNGCWRFV